MEKALYMLLLLLCSACMDLIDITGIDRPLLFMNLYNSAHTRGRSRFSFSREKKIDIKDSKKYVGKYLKTLDDKILEIRVPSESQENVLCAEKYNNANGQALAEKVVRKIREGPHRKKKTDVKDAGKNHSCKCCTSCCCGLCKCLSRCCVCLGGICKCLSSLCCCKCCKVKCSASTSLKRQGNKPKETSPKQNKTRENPKNSADTDRQGNKGSSSNPLKDIKDGATSTAGSAAGAAAGGAAGAAAGGAVGAAAGAAAGGAAGAAGCLGATAGGCLGATAGSCLGGALAGAGTYGGYIAAGAGVGSTAAIAGSGCAALIGCTAVGLTMCLCPSCCSMLGCLGNSMSSCISGCCSCVSFLANAGSSCLSGLSCICNTCTLCSTCLCKTCFRCCCSTPTNVTVNKTVVQNIVVSR